MTIKPESTRPWLKRSLHAFFVVAAVVIFWLGWDLLVLHRRQETRAALALLGAEIDDELTFPGHDDPRLPTIPVYRRWLGDHAIWGITFPPGTPAELLARFDRDFPETPREYRVY